MTATILENGGGAGFVPVVDDVLQDIGVAAGRHRCEKVAGDELAAFGESRSDERPRFFDCISAVEKDTVRARVWGENRWARRAVAASDLDDGMERRKVAGGDHGRRLPGRLRDHGLLENLRGLGVAREKIEGVRAVDAVEGRPPALHAVE